MPNGTATRSTGVLPATSSTSARYRRGSASDHNCGAATGILTPGLALPPAGSATRVSADPTAAFAVSKSLTRTVTLRAASPRFSAVTATLTAARALDTSGVVTNTPQSGTCTSPVTFSET